MAIERTVEITNKFTEVNLNKGSYFIQSLNPSVIVEYSLRNDGQDVFTIDNVSTQYSLPNNGILYLRAPNLQDEQTTKVYINDYSTVATAPLANAQSSSLEINNKWTALSLAAGSYYLIAESGNTVVSMSLSEDGTNSKPLKRGEQVSLNGQTTLYFKLNTEDENAVGSVKYNTINVIASTGSSDPTPGPTPQPGKTYTFNAPLKETNSNVSLQLTESLKVSGGKLDLDLKKNKDFKDVLVDVEGSKAPATKDTKGIVQIGNGIDVTIDGTISVSGDYAKKNEANTFTKLNTFNSGLKTNKIELFGESTTLAPATGSNPLTLSLSNGNTAYTIIDGKDTAEITNIKYKPNTEENNKYVASIKNVIDLKTELNGSITTLSGRVDDLDERLKSVEGNVFIVGQINKSKEEVEAQTTLLDTFVQTQTKRPKRKGDVVKTNDNYEFYYNGEEWINLGQTNIGFATTASAGTILLGNEDGQLESVNNKGLVRVKGFDTVKQELATKASADDVTNIQNQLGNFAVKNEVYTKDQANTTFVKVNDFNTYKNTVYTKLEADEKFVDVAELGTTLESYVSSESLTETLKDYTKNEEFNTFKNTVYTKGQVDEKITTLTGKLDAKADKTYVDNNFLKKSDSNGFAKLNEANTFTKANNFNDAVTITGDLTVSDVIIDAFKVTPNRDYLEIAPTNGQGVKSLNLSSSATDYFNIDMQSRGKIVNLKDPEANTDAVNKQYVDTKDEELNNKFNDYLPLTGGTLTGALIVNESVTANNVKINNTAANKNMSIQYGYTSDGRFNTEAEIGFFDPDFPNLFLIRGNRLNSIETSAGFLRIANAGTLNSYGDRDLLPKKTIVDNFVTKSNGVIETNLDFNNKTGVNVVAPTEDSHIANKKYVDDADAEITEVLNTKANDNEVVKIEGNQTINGQKTFSNTLNVAGTKIYREKLEFNRTGQNDQMYFQMNGNGLVQGKFGFSDAAYYQIFYFDNNRRDGVFEFKQLAQYPGPLSNSLNIDTTEQRSFATLKIVKDNFVRKNQQINMNNNKIINLNDPTNNKDASNKQYTDSRDTAILTESKQYTDTRETEVRSYVDTKSEEALSEAKKYVDANVYITLNNVPEDLSQYRDGQCIYVWKQP